MANLEELKKRLYKERESFDERMVPPGLRKPRSGERAEWQEDAPQEKKTNLIYWIVAGAFVLFISGGIFFFFGPFSVFQVSDVEIAIIGDREIKSGSRVTWNVQINNKSKRDLEEPVLVFNFPVGSTPTSGSRPAGVFRTRKSMEPIKPGESVSEIFDAYVFGGRESPGEVSAVLEYRPKGMSAIFGADSAFLFIVARSPVSVSFNIPHELRIGQKLDFEINYNSQSDEEVRDLYLSAIFPEGFEFVSSIPVPLPGKEKFWKVGNLKAGKSGLIKISGVINGVAAETKVFHASLGVFDNVKNSILAYDEAAVSAMLRPPFLEVALSANGAQELITFPGDNINVEVFWRNNLDRDVKDAILEVKLDGGQASSIDLRSLQIENGAFKEATRSVIWNAGTLPILKNLAPGASGTLKFSFRTKNNFPLDSQASRPVIKATAVFRSGVVVAGFEGVDIGGSSTLEIKIGSRLQLVSKGIYFNSVLPNTGPIPPKVGDETTFTIIWSIANMVNDADEVIITSVLPPYMVFKEIVSPADMNVRFNPNSGEVEWQAGRVSAGTGFLRPALQVAFQVGFLPSESQIGTHPTLIEGAQATGRDTFTESVLSASAGRITTRDDPQIGFEQGRVSQ